jgi:hypothetical protein
VCEKVWDSMSGKEAGKITTCSEFMKIIYTGLAKKMHGK